MTCHPEPYPGDFESDFEEWQRTYYISNGNAKSQAYTTTVGAMIPGRSSNLLPDGTPVSELPEALLVGISTHNLNGTVHMYVMEGYEGLWMRWHSGTPYYPSKQDLEELANKIIEKHGIFALDSQESMACFFVRAIEVEERLQRAAEISQTKRDEINKDVERSLVHARTMQIEEEEEEEEKDAARKTGITAIDEARDLAQNTNMPVWTAQQQQPRRSALYRAAFLSDAPDPISKYFEAMMVDSEILPGPEIDEKVDEEPIF